MTTYVVDRATNFPFLSLRPLSADMELNPGIALINLNADEFEDYTSALGNFLKWQHILADVGEGPVSSVDVPIGEPYGGPLA